MKRSAVALVLVLGLGACGEDEAPRKIREVPLAPSQQPSDTTPDQPSAAKPAEPEVTQPVVPQPPAEDTSDDVLSSDDKELAIGAYRQAPLKVRAWMNQKTKLIHFQFRNSVNNAKVSPSYTVATHVWMYMGGNGHGGRRTKLTATNDKGLYSVNAYDCATMGGKWVVRIQLMSADGQEFERVEIPFNR